VQGLALGETCEQDKKEKKSLKKAARGKRFCFHTDI
jgi:hypothetical protein